MTMADAVHDAPDGCLIDLEVVPGAKADTFPSGYNEWRRRIQARVQAPASDGEANAALLALVARRLDLPAGRVRIVAGSTQRLKRLHVSGVSAERVRAMLAGPAK